MKESELIKTDLKIGFTNWNGKPVNMRKIAYRDAAGNLYFKHNGKILQTTVNSESKYDKIKALGEKNVKMVKNTRKHKKST